MRAVESARNPSWVGVCAGCGRTLISATWATGNGKAEEAMWGYHDGRPVFCTRECRALHEHDVVPSSKMRRHRVRRAAARGETYGA